MPFFSRGDKVSKLTLSDLVTGGGRSAPEQGGSFSPDLVQPRDSLKIQFGKAAYNQAIAKPIKAIRTGSTIGEFNVISGTLANLEEDVKRRFASDQELTQKEVDWWTKTSGWGEVLKRDYEAGFVKIRKPYTSKESLDRLSGASLDAKKDVAIQADVSMAIRDTNKWYEKGVQGIGSIVGFTAQLAALRKVAPGVPEIGVWELQSQISGEDPGKGAAAYLAFTGVAKGAGALYRKIRPVKRVSTIVRRAGERAKGKTLGATRRGVPIRAEAEVFYHGSPTAGLTTIKATRGDYGKGVYLASKDVATKDYAPGRKNVAAYVLGDVKTPLSKGTVYQVSSPMKKPLVIKNDLEYERLLARVGDTNKKIGEYARKEGYDGIINRVTDEHIFFGEQVSLKRSVEETSSQLLDWVKKAKITRGSVVEKELHKLRKKQAGRGAEELRTELGAGTSKYEAILRSKRGYKIKAVIPRVEPPKLSEGNWEALADRALKLYGDTGSKQMTLTNTLDAVHKIRMGGIPTNSEFGLLEPILGKDTVKALYKNLVDKRTFSAWNIPELAVQGGKLIFSLDLQTLRQGRSVAFWHPITYAKGAIADVKGRFSEKAAESMELALKNSTGYKESAKHLNYLTTSIFKKGERLEQFSMGLTERMLGAKFKSEVLDATVGTGIRGYGHLVATSERGAVAGINSMMKGMWDSGERQLAKLGYSKSQQAAFRANRARTINHAMKVIRAKHPKGKQIQAAANYILFSPSVTVSRPLLIADMVRSPGSRVYAAEIITSNIASIMAVGGAINYIAGQRRLKNSHLDPGIDSNPIPWHPDSGKIRVLNTVYEWTGGDAPTYKVIARVGLSAYLAGLKAITGEEKSEVLGVKIPPVGETIMNYLETRETALLGLGKTLITGKDWLGEPISGLDALQKALTPEILTATIEAGAVDGLWQGVAAMMASTGSVGVDTYPVPGYITRKNFRNSIAQATYEDRKWDELSPREQGKLNRTHRVAFQDLNRQVKIENVESPYDPVRTKEAERVSGVKIRGLLTPGVAEKMTGVSLNVNRRPEDFFLNDARYQAYQERVAELLNKRMKTLDFTTKSLMKRMDIAEKEIMRAKKRAFSDVIR